MDGWKCSKCGKELKIEEVFTISKGGPKISLKPYCEPCCDAVLAEHQRTYNEQEL